MAASKRRTRSGHPGVTLIAPSGAHRKWRAKYMDADTGKEKRETFADDITTAEQRRKWAIEKSKDLAKRKMDLDGGAARKTGRELGPAFKDYTAHNTQLRPRTIAIAKTAIAKFEAFAEQEGITKCDEVTRPVLMRFRAYLINLPKKTAKKEGKRGTFKVTGEKRSIPAVNQDLVAIRTVLGYLCDLDQFAKVTRDDLRRALKRLTVTEERIEFLKSDAIKTLLNAAIKHDAVCFAETREEHEGLKEKGTTQRYEAIAPFVLFTLLSGCRRGEALGLDWKQVDLDAKGDDGTVIGEIQIEGTATKTRQRRTLDLTVSPALRSLLVAMHKKAGEPKRGPVFGLTAEGALSAVTRLKGEDFGAPDAFTWQVLRSTCGTFLTNAPGIFGAASAYRSAKQLGHSVAIAEKHYLGLIRGIPREARTLEAAMGIEDLAAKITEAV